jgi:hypothetical protein
MVARNGDGDVSDALVCTSTVFVPCTATTKAIGVVCDHIGTCIVAIIITSDLGGSGVVIVESVAISIGCES